MFFKNIRFSSPGCKLAGGDWKKQNHEICNGENEGWKTQWNEAENKCTTHKFIVFATCILKLSKMNNQAYKKFPSKIFWQFTYDRRRKGDAERRRRERRQASRLRVDGERRVDILDALGGNDVVWVILTVSGVDMTVRLHRHPEERNLQVTATINDEQTAPMIPPDCQLFLGLYFTNAKYYICNHIPSAAKLMTNWCQIAS